MGQRLMSGAGRRVEETTNLDGVTSATTGSSVDCRWYNRITIFVNVTVNTGAVTVTQQASIDGSTWFDLVAKTYTASVTNDVYHYGSSTFYPYVRTKTSTQSNSTVTTFVAARN